MLPNFELCQFFYIKRKKEVLVVGSLWGSVALGDSAVEAGESILPTPIRNRQPSIPSKSARRNLNARRCLPAFILVNIYGSDNASDKFFAVAHCNDVLQAGVVFDIGFENGVEYGIRGQAVGVFLVIAQFGSRWALDNGWGNDIVVGKAVAVVREVVDEGFVDVFDDGKSTGHVAVEGGVAHAHFAFVAGGKHEGAEFVG